MEMNSTSQKCHSCGAPYSLEKGRDKAFCKYCGSEILLINENEYTVRHIDEASIKRAEAEQMILLKKLDLEEKKRLSEEKAKRNKIIISLVLAAVGLAMMILGNIGGKESGDPDSELYMIGFMGLFPLMGACFVWIGSTNKSKVSSDGRVKVPNSISGYEGKNFESIKSILENAGFTNIKSVPLKDLRLGILKKPGGVESITINGERISSGGDKFLPTASVLISYHSFSS